MNPNLKSRKKKQTSRIQPSFNIDFREVNNYTQNDINENSILNFINLTQYSIQTLENDDMTLKGSELNTIIYSNINEKGILFFVNEIQTAVVNQPNNQDKADEIQANQEKLRNEIYNSNNQISLEDANIQDQIFKQIKKN